MDLDCFPVAKLLGITGPIIPSWDLRQPGWMELVDPDQDYECWWAQIGPDTYIPIPLEVIREMQETNPNGHVYEVDFRTESASAAGERIRGELNAAAQRVKNRSRTIPEMLL